MLKTFAATELVTFSAFCDVDLEGALTAEARALYPDVPRFRDFRSMFDAAGDSFAAVVVCTPDHAHFPAAMHAMARGKHVYVEKPLAQSFREVDLLMAMAERTGVAEAEWHHHAERQEHLISPQQANALAAIASAALVFLREGY